jgi:hypothetical protein
MCNDFARLGFDNVVVDAGVQLSYDWHLAREMSAGECLVPLIPSRYYLIVLSHSMRRACFEQTAASTHDKNIVPGFHMLAGGGERWLCLLHAGYLCHVLNILHCQLDVC